MFFSWHQEWDLDTGLRLDRMTVTEVRLLLEIDTNPSREVTPWEPERRKTLPTWFL